MGTAMRVPRAARPCALYKKRCAKTAGRSSGRVFSLNDGAPVAGKARGALFLQMILAERLVFFRSPQLADGAVVDLSNGHGRFVVYIARVDRAVPPDEGAAPEVGAGGWDLVDRHVVGVFPG